MSFLPTNYKLPKTIGNYMKWELGSNAFRILGDSVIGWEYWVDKKPIRKHNVEEISLNDTPAEGVKHFWAFPVWNYQEKRVQILEITQKGIMKSMKALIEDEENWGSPLNYDIVVTREGEGMDTEYQLNPRPPKVLAKEIKNAYEKMTIDLELLFSGGDPFKTMNENVNPEDIKL